LYLAGKQGGQAAIDQRPKLKPKFAQMSEAVEQRSTALLLAYRFIYGFRIVLPTLFGVVKVPVRRLLHCLCPVRRRTRFLAVAAQGISYIPSYFGSLTTSLTRLDRVIFVIFVENR